MKSMHKSCLAAVAVAAVLAVPANAQKKDFDIKGTWIEGCSCPVVCACEMNGVEKGCEGVAAALISSGKYGGVDLSGVKIAVGMTPGSWVRLFIDAKDPAQMKAAEGLGRGLTAVFGKVESVKPAKVAVTGSNGNYTVTVDGGKVFKLTTAPVLGGDKKTAIAHTNYPNPINHTMMQAKVVSCRYNDGKHKFSLKGSNAFFNTKMGGSG